MGHKIEIAADTRSVLGEGAYWDAGDQLLWWVDITAGLIHAYDPKTGNNATYDFGEPVGCLARRDAGGLVLAAKSGFWFYDPITGERRHLGDPELNHPNNRFNDGGTDLQGRFWGGTMVDDGPAEKIGRFYRLDADLTITAWDKPFFTTNGLTFSPDGSTMYCSDSNAAIRTIWAYDYDTSTGTPSNERVFFDTNAVAGRPDGGTVDAQGCYWQAGISGWQVNRISPQGELLLSIELPIERPTKPMFGGPNLDILYVTSLSKGLTPGTHQPHAGSLFAIHDLGVKGIPQTRFMG